MGAGCRGAPGTDTATVPSARRMVEVNEHDRRRIGDAPTLSSRSFGSTRRIPRVEPRLETFELEEQPFMTLYIALNRIREEQDPRLQFDFAGRSADLRHVADARERCARLHASASRDLARSMLQPLPVFKLIGAPVAAYSAHSLLTQNGDAVGIDADHVLDRRVLDLVEGIGETRGVVQLGQARHHLSAHGAVRVGRIHQRLRRKA